MKTRVVNSRLRLLLLGILLTFAVLGARAAWIQTVRASSLAAMAQTDCGACGWDCEGYGKALATGETKDISLCTPGEQETLDALKKLMAEAGLEVEGV